MVKYSVFESLFFSQGEPGLWWWMDGPGVPIREGHRADRRLFGRWGVLPISCWGMFAYLILRVRSFLSLNDFYRYTRTQLRVYSIYQILRIYRFCWTLQYTNLEYIKVVTWCEGWKVQSKFGYELRWRDRCRLRGHQEDERDWSPGCRLHSWTHLRRNRRLSTVLPILPVSILS